MGLFSATAGPAHALIGPTADGWGDVPVDAKLKGMTLRDGWTDPRIPLGDIDRPGWEDSAYFRGTATGYEFHYSFVDLGPRGWSGSNLAPNQKHFFKMYRAVVHDQRWVSKLLPFNTPNNSDAAAGMAGSGRYSALTPTS